MIFNGILAVVALLNMYQSIAQVKVSGSVRYENFLQLYAFVAALEFMLLMFIMPALTSASISGERERYITRGRSLPQGSRRSLEDEK